MPAAGEVVRVNLGQVGGLWTLCDDAGNAILVNTATSAIRLGRTGGTVGFYGTTPIALQTGVAVSAAGVHAAGVALGLWTA